MSKYNLAKKSQKIFLNNFKNYPEVLSIAPGRVNLIGEHVDYNSGLSMPAAIDRYVCVAMSKNDKKRVRVYSSTFQEMYDKSIKELKPTKLWHKYVLGSISEAINGKILDRGLDVVISSDLPMGKGLSSSAALEVSMVQAVSQIFNLELSDKEVIKKCQQVDHNHVGVLSGTLDQSASKLSKKGSLLLLDFRDNSFSYVSNSLSNCKWVLIDSMIKRELATSKYKERVSECKDALSLIMKANPRGNNFRDFELEDLESVGLSQKLLKRSKHVIEENSRVLDMVDALKKNSPEDVGKLLIRSHESLKNLYEVSCDEIDFLIGQSQSRDDWYGGRIMGGGFGGNTINLVRKNKELDYIDWISEIYKRKFGIFPDSYLVDFQDGAKILDNISGD